MFSKHKNSANETAKFYQAPANIEEVQSGFMYKSPSQAFSRSLKSWKRRFFVLTKTTINHYELKFFRDENRREKPLGQINLYQVSLLFRNVESQPLWLWIQKNFRCLASCVLYMRVSERDYFLIGENSGEMDTWFNAIFKALNTQVDTLPEDDRKNRSQSASVSVLFREKQWSEEQEQENPKPSLLVRQSAPASFNSQYSHYDYPKNYLMTASLSPESEDTEEDEEEEVQINRESETEGDTNYYMDMTSVREVLLDLTQNDVLFPQRNLERNKVSENSSLQTGIEERGSTALNSETFVAVEKEICVNQDELKNSIIFSEEAGRLCVSNWRQSSKQSSGLFHKGDQILAINDLLTDSLVELQSYLKRLNKNEVKLTILRQPGSQPLCGCYT